MGIFENAGLNWLLGGIERLQRTSKVAGSSFLWLCGSAERIAPPRLIMIGHNPFSDDLEREP